MRRVLYVIHGLTTGGAEVDLVRKSGYLAQGRGYEPTVCCLMRRGELARVAEQSGIKVVGPLMRNRYDVTAAPVLRRLLTSGQFDLVHSQIYAANLVTWQTWRTIPRSRRLPWLASEHAMAERWSRPAIQSIRRIARAADRLLLPSASAKASYVACDIPADAISIMPNVIDTQPFDRTERAVARQSIRRELGINEEEFVLGAICRLETVKNLPMLLEAVGPLGRTTLLVGDGSQRQQLEALAERFGNPGQFRFLGRRTDVAPCHRRPWISLSPLRHLSRLAWPWPKRC